MTRSEEEMHVGVERHESGRARLRKYVVAEEQRQTVAVRHEEVRVEREPITEANRDASLSVPAITEDEHEVTLYAEETVVETCAVPVERVADHGGARRTAHGPQATYRSRTARRVLRVRQQPRGPGPRGTRGVPPRGGTPHRGSPVTVQVPCARTRSGCAGRDNG